MHTMFKVMNFNKNPVSIMYGILKLWVALTLGSEVQNNSKNEPPGCDVYAEWVAPTMGHFHVALR